MPLAKSAMATNVILSFIWSRNRFRFMWFLIATRFRRFPSADLAARPRAEKFMSYRAPRPRAHAPARRSASWCLALGILLFLPAQKGGRRVRGPDLGSNQGMSASRTTIVTGPRWKRLLLNRPVIVPALLVLITLGWNLGSSPMITASSPAAFSTPTARRWKAPRSSCGCSTSPLSWKGIDENPT